MTLLDRYIIRQYLINFLILLTVCVSLFVIGGVLLDMDEYVEAGQRLSEEFGGSTLGWTLWSILDYDGPTQLMMYAFFSGLIALGAAGFTLTGLARSRELLAMLSSGISMHRIVLPILMMGFCLNFLALVDQEILIPHFANKLSRYKSDLKKRNRQAKPIYFMADGKGQLFSAGNFKLTDENALLVDLVILQRDKTGRTLRRIVASEGLWDPARQGWELTQGYVTTRPNIVGETIPQPTATQGGEIFFLKSDLSPTVIQSRRISKYMGLLSIRQLQKLLSHSNIDKNHIQRIMHGRFSQLVLNMLILTMGATFFLSREPTNALLQTIKAAGLCIGAWATGLVMQNTQIAGLNPVATVWLPVVMYIPVTAITLQWLKT